MHVYTPKTLIIIAIGSFIKIDADEALNAIGCAILPSSAFSFNKCAMAIFINSNPGVILDRRLPQLLSIGSDRKDDTRPVVTMSPNYKGARELFGN